MNGRSWTFLLALGGAVAVLFGVFVGLLKVADRLFIDHRAEVARWEPAGFSDDGREITVRYSTSQCAYDPFDRVERAETDSTVTLTVITRYRIGGPGCDDVAVYHETDVKLDRPLGDRRLIDGRIDAAPSFETPTTVAVAVRQIVDVSRGSYADGSVSYIRVYDEPYGEGVLAQRLPDPVTSGSTLVSSLTVRVRPGDYRLVSGQLPCEGTCDSLGRPADRCSGPIELVALRPLAVTVNVRPGAGCTVDVK